MEDLAKAFNLLILILFILFPISNGSILKDFLKLKSIRHITIFNCADYSTNIQLFKSLRHGSVYAKIYSIDTCCDFGEDNKRAFFYLDATCDNWVKVVQGMSDKKMFSDIYHWLIKTSNYSEVRHELSQVPLRVDSEVTVAVETSENDFDLYDVYNSGFYNFGRFNSTKIGSYNKNAGITLPNQYKYMRRANMSGVVLKCVIVVTRKLTHERFEEYLEMPKLTHIDSMNRYNYAILLHVSNMYNYRYSMVRTNSWGYPHNGTFDGMIGFLQKGQADVGGSPIFYRRERSYIIDYTALTWSSRPCFMFRHPKKVGSFYNIYTRPLDNPVWFCALALFALVAVALRSLFKRSEGRTGDAVDSSWSYTVLAVLSAACQQGLTVDHSSTVIRLLVFVLFLFALTMYQFYSASITSSLLMEAPRNIRTLEDLLNSPLKAGVEDIIYNFDYFTRTTDPVALELYRKKIVTPKGKNFFSVAEGMAMVKKGGFAFHADIATAYRVVTETFTEKEICELAEIQLFPTQKALSIVKKGSPYREPITYGLRKLAEAGLMHRQKLLWHEPTPKCVNTPDSSIFSVTIYEFSMVLLILLSGAVLSLVALTVEIIVHAHSGRAVRMFK